MNKKVIIVLSIIFILVLIASVAGYVLYSTTDMFKPNSQMFQRYFLQNLSTINEITDLSNEEKYVTILNQKKYRDNTTIKVDYTNSKGKQENFNISLNGIINNENKNSYRQINVKYGDEVNVLNTELLKENQTYGVLFSDAVKQFVSADFNNVNDFFDKTNIEKSRFEKYSISNIIEIIRQKENIEKIIIDFSKEIGDKQYTLQKQSLITLSNGQSQTTNAYILNLSSKQTKNLFLQILQQLNSEQLINEINQTNKQFAETKITQYVLNDKTSRIVVQEENTELIIDFYENELNIKYNNITSQDIKTINLNVKQQEDKKYIEYSDSNSNKAKVEFSENLNDNNANANIKFNMQNQYIKQLNISLEQSLEFSNSIIAIQKKLSKEPNINIDKLNENERNSILSSWFKRINSNLQKVNNRINSEIVNLIIDENKNLAEKYEHLKDISIQDYNNLFIPYQGEKIDKNIVYNMLDIVGRNMKKYETVNEDRINIYLEQGTENVQMSQEIKQIVEKSENASSYNINFQYNSQGKIVLILMEKNNEKDS